MKAQIGSCGWSFNRQGEREMENVISQLKKLQKGEISPQWGGDVMGMNAVDDFVDYPDELDLNTYDALRGVVEHRIAETLTAESGENVWERWCNEDITADFSDIQKIIDSI